MTDLSARPASLPRASDGILAMLISICALPFMVNFVTPFPDAMGGALDGRGLLGLAGRMLLTAVIIERMVALGIRWRRSRFPESDQEDDRTAFLALCLGGLLASLTGVRALDSLLASEAVASLATGRQALLIWTDLVISTGIIVGVADSLRRAIRSAALWLSRGVAA